MVHKLAILLTAFFLGLLSPALALADTPMKPKNYVQASSNGKYFVKVMAGNWKETPPSITAYKISGSGDFEEIWSTSGWYAFQVFLSDDGKYLVRKGPWSWGKEPSDKHLALAFYKEGVKIKHYTTRDLVTDPKAVITTSNHYYWLSQDRTRPSMKMTFYDFVIRTVEGWTYIFDYKTGEIKKKKKTD